MQRVLENSGWLRRCTPFPHVYARDLFKGEAYRRLEVRFCEVLTRGFGPPGSVDRFSRNMSGYDAYGLHLRPDSVDGHFGLFLTREWHDLMAGLRGVAATGDV